MNSAGLNYNKFFGFSELPFQEELDQKFIFLAGRQEALLADLVNFITSHQGVAVLEGDHGVGKTVSAHALVQRIPQNFHPLIISEPPAEPLALTVSIAQALAINIKEDNLLYLNRLGDAVQAAARQGQFYFVVIDDAQGLTDQHLEEVWVLSQMEFHGHHLLPVVLVAGQELSRRLGGHDNPRLARLVDKVVNLACLTPEETILYIDHRLHQAGSRFASCFAEDCAGRLHVLTDGNPSRINTVCHEALKRCWQANLPTVTLAMLRGEGETNFPEDQVTPAKNRFWKIMGAVTGLALVSSLAAYVIHTGQPDKMSARKIQIPETLDRNQPNPTYHQTPSPLAGPKPPTHQEQAELAALRRQVSFRAELLSAKERQTVNEPSAAEALPASPPESQATEAEWTTPGSYEVTAKDRSLNKIVAAHYPHNEKFGFVAVILANPKIIEEELIYPGQVLILPTMNKKNNFIRLNDKLYYLLHKRYNDISQLNKMTSGLKELKIRFIIRETEHPTAGKVYRIYLGGYEHEGDLKKAQVAIENK